MKCTPTVGSARRLGSLFLLIAYLSSCMSWKPQRGPVDRALPSGQPQWVRATLADGRNVHLWDPRIERDSLIGEEDSPVSMNVRGHRRAIPTDSVTGVALRRLARGRTAVLVVAVGVTLLAIVGSAGEPQPEPQPEPIVSCPLVYSWDGTQWRLDSGTFGGAIMPIFARTDVDNLDFATPDSGILRLRLANELSETDYVDAVSVLAVDHDPAAVIAPSADGTIHTLGALQAPRSAVDYRDNDAIDRVRTVDGWSWESRPSGRDSSRAADVRDGLTLTFDKPRGATTARLVLDGRNTPWASYMVQQFVSAHGHATQAWYDSVNTSQAMARQLGAMMAREGFLDVQLRVGGRWEHRDYIWEAGPEVSKRQVVSLDVSGVDGDVVEIRLESAPMFWLIDQVALDFSAPREAHSLELRAERAVDHVGADVRSALRSADRNYHVLATGERTELTFRVPPVPRGLARSYLLRSTGWYRITTPEVLEPDLAMLHEVNNRPHGGSRVSVARFNAAVRALGEASR